MTPEFILHKIRIEPTEKMAIISNEQVNAQIRNKIRTAMSQKVFNELRLIISAVKIQINNTYYS